MHPVIAGLALCGQLAATTAAEPPPPPGAAANRATTLYQNVHCGGEAGLEWIADSERLEALNTELGQHRLEDSPPTFAAVTPNTQVLLLRMGVQPTPGYGATPGDTRLSPDGHDLVISVDWHSPPEGLLLPQMITTPCVLFAVAEGPYTRVKLLDQDGTPRGQAESAPTATSAAD